MKKEVVQITDKDDMVIAMYPIYIPDYIHKLIIAAIDNKMDVYTVRILRLKK